LTETQIEYFRNSKVRKDGKLLPLYHGSLSTDIVSFSTEFYGRKTGVPDKYIFFTNDFNTADNFSKEYSQTQSKFVVQPTGKSGKTYNVYVNMVNPLNLNNLTEQDKQFIARSYAETFGTELSEGLRHVTNSGTNQQYMKIAFDAKQLQSAGYDGLIAEMYAGTGIFEYGVFNGEQIKAIENKEPQTTTNIYDEARPQKTTTRPLTQEEKQKILDIFPSDEFIDTYFEVNANGNYVPKEALVRTSTLKRNYATLREIDPVTQKVVTNKYNSNEYAVNVDVGFGQEIDITTENIKVVKLADIIKDPATASIYHTLKSLGIRFVGYENTTASNTLGFSFRTIESDVVFVNFSYFLSYPKVVFETIFHELTHEIFKTNRRSLVELSKLYRQVFINEVKKKGVTTYEFSEGYKTFDDEFKRNNGGISFAEYLSKSYKSTAYFINDPKNLHDLLFAAERSYIDLQNNDSNEVKTINEFIAQITGMMIASDTLINEVFKVTDYQKLRLFSFYEQIIANPKVSPVLNKAKMFGSTFHKAYLAHEKIMQQKFPLKKNVFTAQEANEFVDSFTDGAFKTRADLMKEYQAEIQKGKRGEAHFAINAIIQIASKFGKAVKDAVESTDNIKNFFQRQIDGIDLLLENPDDASYISVTKMPKVFKIIEKLFTNQYDSLQKNIEQRKTDKSIRQNPFNNLDFIYSFSKNFTEFIEQYSGINPDILDLFDLPGGTLLSVDVQQLGIDIEEATEVFVQLTETYNQQPDSQKDIDLRYLETLNFIRIFETFSKTFEQIKKLSNKNYEQLMKISKLSADVFDLDTNKLFLVLKNAVQKTFKAINTGNQAKSTMNRELIDAFDAVNELLELIKKPVLNKATLETKVLETIKKLDEIITRYQLDADGKKISSGRVFEVYSVLDANGQIDVKQTIDDIREKFLFDIYGFYGAIFNKQDALFDPGNFTDAQNVTVESLGYKKNYYSFAKAISKLFFAIETEYLSVFGEVPYQQLTDQETKVLLKINNRNKGGVKQLIDLQDGGVTGLYSPIDINLPQHIMQTYEKIFSANGSTLFKKFFDLYLDMTYRRTDIISEYQRERELFLETHKGIEDFENETVDTPEQLVFGLSDFDYKSILDKVKDSQKDKKDQLEQKRKEVKQLNVLNKKDREEIVRLTKLRELEIKSSQQWLDFNNAIAALRLKIKSRNTDKEKINLEIKTLVATSFTFAQELKLELIKFAEDNNIEKAKMTRGEIVNLYMNIKREEAMHNETDSLDPYAARIKPTRHFEIGGSFYIFDSNLAIEKSYAEAKSKAAKTSYVIFQSRPDMLRALEEFMDKDMQYEILIEEAKRVYKQNYLYINEIFSARFQADLPTEEFYSPFRTLDSDWSRNFELKRKNKNNIAVADGFTLETTIGAATALVIQNVSSVMSGTTTATANYSYERLITDFQSLMVSKASGSNRTYIELLGAVDGRSFLVFFEKTFTDVLGYGLERLGAAERAFSAVQNATISASMALSLSVYSKQFISVIKISSGGRLNIFEMVYNVARHGIPFYKTELRRWLLDNNSNMYQRSEFSGVANIASTVTADTFTRYRRGFRKFTNNFKEVIGKFNNHADSTVLVAAFATLVNKVQKENPNLTQEQVREKANEIFKRTTLLYDVANTDTAFRTRFSTSKNFLQRFVAKYMSENMIQISNMQTSYRNYTLGMGGFDDFLRAIFEFIASSLSSALVGVSFSRLNGFIEEDEIVSDFFVNELILQNLLGAIPYANLVTSLFQVVDGKLTQAYDVRLPLVSDLANLVKNTIRFSETVGKVVSGELPPSKIFRETIRLIEGTSNFTGIPFANFRKIVGYILKLETEWFGGDSYFAFEEFFFGRTNAQQLGIAVKANDEDKINSYIGRTVENVFVKDEIIKVLVDNEDASISLRFNADTFKAQNPLNKKEMTTYKIPEKTLEKYKILSQRTLSFLIKNPKYKKLSKEKKLASIQRVLNYFYNFMKNELLIPEYKSLPANIKKDIGYDSMRRRELLNTKEVIENALKDV